MPTLQSPGIGSGLDVNSIVSQLMAIEQRPLLQLNQKEAQAQAELKRWMKQYPAARVVRYADAGHFVADEKPRELIAEMEKLLEG